MAKADEFRLASEVRLQLDTSSCHSGKIDVDALIAVLQVELSDKSISYSSGLSLHMKQCEKRLSKVLLQVAMPGELRAEREVDLSSIVDSAQPRALALIFMDLIRSRPTLANDLPHKSEVVPTARKSASRVLGQLVYRYYERWSTSLAGLAVSTVHGPFRFGVITTAGGNRDSLGTIVFGTAALSGSVEILATPSFYARLAAEAGAAWARGLASEPMTVEHNAVAPHLAVNLELGVQLYSFGNLHIDVGVVGGLASGLVAKSGRRSVGGVAGAFGGTRITLHLPF